MPYTYAASYVHVTALSVARLIDKLITFGLNCSELKLIGHSLGAHVMGIAAYNAKCIVAYVVGEFGH